MRTCSRPIIIKIIFKNSEMQLKPFFNNIFYFVVKAHIFWAVKIYTILHYSEKFFQAQNKQLIS
jgi:hypothetical protein